MSFNFDPEWLRRLERQMEQIRRTFDNPAIREALRRIETVQPTLDRINKLIQPQMEAVDRALRAWQAGPGYEATRQALEQSARLAEQIQRAVDPWRGRLPEIMEAAARAARAAHEAWEAAVPGNWRDLAFDEIERVLDVMEESGWALVWTPRAEIVRELIGTESESRDEKLLEREQAVLDDLSEATRALAVSPEAELAAANQEAIGSYLDGRYRASQALATVIFTTLFHRYVSEKFAKGRMSLEPLDPREATLGNVRRYCVLRSVLVAIDTYFGRDDEPIPTRFNRHASTHRLSPEQYTKLNALAALMLTTSLLSEVAAGGTLLPAAGD
jgi:hypothetical protein